jgi:hypothetical protein
MSIAWTGKVTIARADWGDETGTTVTFKLPMNKEAQDKRNPFHAFTKRRKGRAGTRFMMACQTAGEGVRHALYEDEAMLAGWNDSQTAGHTVKMWLCNDGMGHPFEGVSRQQELLVSLIELDDDQEVVDQKMRDKVEQQRVKPSQRPSYGAVMLCKNPEFHEWIMHDERINQIMQEGSGEADLEQVAKEWMCRTLGIKSRSELDKSEELRLRYHNMIDKPFMATQGTPF